MTYTKKGYTESEILEALNMIKDICDEQEDCETCPFADRVEVCHIQTKAPQDWDLRKERVWRAFD